MKRFLILFLTVFLAIFVLISCKGDDFNKGSGHYGGTNTDSSTNDASDTNTNTNVSTDTSIDTNTNTDTSTDISTDTNTNIDTSTDTNIDIDDASLITYNGLVYMLKSDNTLKVVTYEVYDDMPGSFSVPSIVQGYTVTEIGTYAFNGYGEIAEVINSSIGFVTIRLPETVTKIDKFAFSNCADVKVQFDSTNATITRDEWVEILEIEHDDGHDENNICCNCKEKCHQVLDTIMLDRPAIGWYRYKK